MRTTTSSSPGSNCSRALHCRKEGVRVAGLVPPGHKLAVRDIAAGEPVRRYGQIIGFASQAIRCGAHVHVHNLAMGSFDRDAAGWPGIDARPRKPWRSPPPSWASCAPTAAWPRATTSACSPR
jgi:hypothetical protein